MFKTRVSQFMWALVVVVVAGALGLAPLRADQDSSNDPCAALELTNGPVGAYALFDAIDLACGGEAAKARAEARKMLGSDEGLSGAKVQKGGSDAANRAVKDVLNR